MPNHSAHGSFFGPSHLVDLVRHRARCQPADLAYKWLVDGEVEEIDLTNAELDRRARAIGAWLQSRNLAGERALLLFPPGLDFITAFFGCLYAGVVAVPAYPPRKNRSLARIVAIADDAEAKVALTTTAVWERVQPTLSQTPELNNVVWLTTDAPPPGLEDTWVDPQISSDTLAFLQYTSGSTGKPKGVMLTHSNLVHNSALIQYAFEHTRSGTGVFWLPSYHDMGLIGGILQPVYVGRPNVLMSPMSFLQKPLRWLQAITRYRGSTSGGPNFAYELCTRKITNDERDLLDLSCWRLAFNGAEPVLPQTLEAFAEKFGPCGFRAEAFYPCYGMAESTLIITGGEKHALPVVRAVDARALESHRVVLAGETTPDVRRVIGCGEALPDGDVRIVDPESCCEMPAGQVGEVWARGPSVAKGYFRRPEETAATFGAHLADSGEGPFLRTGDLGFLLERELFITGRIKDLIIIRGLNHYPQDIERTAQASHSLLVQGAGAAFTVELDGQERLVLVQEIERRREAPWGEAIRALRDAVNQEHELTLDAVALLKPGSIPKTSSGKIQRHACRAAFLDGSLSVVAQWKAGDPEVAAPSPAPAADAALDGTLEERFCTDLTSLALRRVPAPGPAVARVEVNGSGVHASLPAQDVSKVVMEAVRAIGKERAANLSLDSSITGLGLDSLERIELVARLEERFGTRFHEEEAQDLDTIRDCVQAVENHLRQGRGPRHAPPKPGGPIPEEFYRFDKFPEFKKLEARLEMLESTGLGNPFFNVHEALTSDTTVIDGRKMVNFSAYNYVGMSGDPAVSAAAKAAIDRFGTSVSASRVVSGEKTLHRQLERALSTFLGTQDTVLYVGGHSTNETTIGHLFGPGDLVLHDALAHNSIMQGCILSGARRRAFPHNDWQALDELLAEIRHEYRRVLVAIEGVYSMDGDFPDLPAFIQVKKRRHAFLMVDEAHSVGVLGRTGRGIGEHFGVDRADVDLWMGTLSKAFGSCGGYISGVRELITYLKYTAPGFVYSVGLSPPNAAAALASIQTLEREPKRVETLRQRARLFLGLAKERGLDTGLSRDSAVVPVIIGNSVLSLMLSRAMFERGVNVHPILYPAVEESAARLRFFICSTHTEEQIRYTVDACATELERLRKEMAGSEAFSPAGEV